MAESAIRIFFCTALIFAAGGARADVLPAPLFCDRMVLQRDTPLPVWGIAEPGERVAISIADQKAETVTGADGRWELLLPALAAGGPFEFTVSGEDETIFRDVMVGEVWVCSGQSNMRLGLAQSSGGAEAAKHAGEFPGLRLFDVPRMQALEPQASIKARWKVSSPAAANDFSAVGFLFGRELAAALDVPVGMICGAVGGTTAAQWTPRHAFLSNPVLAPLDARLEEELRTRPESDPEYPAKLEAWQREAQNARAEGRQPPPAPLAPIGSWPPTPSGLYNGMIAPLIPYGIRGVIWYQGEGGSGLGSVPYSAAFPAMIRSWRQAWGQGDFPFLFVQLPNYQMPQHQPVENGGWAGVREEQSAALRLPNTAMAVTIDVGDAHDIHPRNKLDVATRLALAALGTVYGKQVVWSGPVYKSMSVEQDNIRIRFEHADDGLVVKGEELKGFAIAGADRVWAWAEAAVEGESVVARSDAVPAPVAVRYGWGANPPCNLYNAHGLPAAPFRTDEW